MHEITLRMKSETSIITIIETLLVFPIEPRRISLGQFTIMNDLQPYKLKNVPSLFQRLNQYSILLAMDPNLILTSHAE